MDDDWGIGGFDWVGMGLFQEFRMAYMPVDDSFGTYRL